MTTPWRLETGPPGNQTATTGGTGPVFPAVSADNTLITAHPDPSASAGGQTPPPGSTFEVTVHVNPRPGFKAPGAQPN